MSDFDAAPASGAPNRPTGPASGGSPPPVLVAALATALLIAVGLVALFWSGGGNDAQPVLDGAELTTPPARTRVELTVSVDGSGSGRVRIASGISCRQSCEHEFAYGKRLTVTADAADGSSFDGWADACDGTSRCSFVMDGDRSLTASFKRAPSDAPCDADVDPSCAATIPAEPPPPVPTGDCNDGRDNDGDGLTDVAQDPDCEHGSETGSTAPKATTTAPPPPTATTNQCSDGRDNDGDGLTDRPQDPDCRTGRSESSPARGRSECQDGRDNDGDGLIDAAQDPGCATGRTEAG